MANTIVKMDSTSALGVYRHVETGFVVHDVNSVADVINANGCLACDMTNGTWAWIAGEDLFVEVYRRGATSLRTLATGLLGSKLSLVAGRLTLGVWFASAKVGGMNSGGIAMPGLNRFATACGTDLRIFGIVTNAQAGRGLSTGLLDDVIANVPGALLAGCTDSCDISGFENAGMSDPVKVSPPGLSGITSIAYQKHASIIGRAVIAIPVSTWDAFLANWKVALPHVDKEEVASKADAAIQKFGSAFQSNLFSVPSVRVPVVLTSDGKAYMDNNLPRSFNTQGTIYGIWSYWNGLLAPTLPDPSGWWLTNPHCPAVGVAHQMSSEVVAGLGSNFFNASGVDSPKAAVPFTASYAQVTDIDSVELMKILGGLYPRTDAVPSSTTGAFLINRCFSGNHSDQPLPTQGGAETQVDYTARMTTAQKAPYSVFTANYGHWNLAGQPAVWASTLLDASLQGKSINGLAALTLVSGNLCSLLRVPGGACRGTWNGADLVANPAPFLRHQYAF